MMMMIMIIIRGKKVKIGLRSHCNEKSFPYQRLRTKPRFDTEARGTRK